MIAKQYVVAASYDMWELKQRFILVHLGKYMYLIKKV